jgi:hypothetical protein
VSARECVEADDAEAEDGRVRSIAPAATARAADVVVRPAPPPITLPPPAPAPAVVGVAVVARFGLALRVFDRIDG